MKHFFALLLLAAAPLTALAHGEEKVSISDEGKAVLAIDEQDILYGKADAPNTLIEYSSLSCGHCATFNNNVLPAVKQQFIETGVLKLSNRAFPLNAPALKASMLVQCAPENKQAKFQDVLFQLQNKWAFSADYEAALKKIAAVGGISADAFDACMQNSDIEAAVLERRKEASDHLPIKGTPAFFLNGTPFHAPMNAAAFTEALREALKKDEAKEAAPSEQTSEPSEATEAQE